MINLLYDRRVQWHDSVDAEQLFTSYARALSLDVEKFASDLRGELVSERIQLDMKRAESLGVRGTPTVFMNGKDVGFPVENMHRAIKEALGLTKP